MSIGFSDGTMAENWGQAYSQGVERVQPKDSALVQIAMNVPKKLKSLSNADLEDALNKADEVGVPEAHQTIIDEMKRRKQTPYLDNIDPGNFQGDLYDGTGSDPNNKKKIFNDTETLGQEYRNLMDPMKPDAAKLKDEESNIEDYNMTGGKNPTAYLMRGFRGGISPDNAP